MTRLFGSAFEDAGQPIALVEMLVLAAAAHLGGAATRYGGAVRRLGLRRLVYKAS